MAEVQDVARDNRIWKRDERYLPKLNLANSAGLFRVRALRRVLLRLFCIGRRGVTAEREQAYRGEDR